MIVAVMILQGDKWGSLCVHTTSNTKIIKQAKDIIR